MSRVEYQGVEKRFGDVVALSRFDLAVPDGTFLVMLGPSGCGKTAALRILAGLELSPRRPGRRRCPSARRRCHLVRG